MFFCWLQRGQKLVATLAVGLLYCAGARASELKDNPSPDLWAIGATTQQIHWDVRVEPVALSLHQRLQVTIQAVVPGKELERLRGKGQLDLRVRYQDAAGASWSAHEAMDLTLMAVGVKARQLTITSAAFVLPGTYQVALELSNSETGERSLERRILHVTPLRNDPLPAAWTNLPPVEILPMVESPDSWFLPSITGGVQLRAATAKPLDIELLVNTTPTDFAAGSMRGVRNVMRSVMPAVKVLAGLGPHVSFLDATRHKVSYSENDGRQLEWDALKGVLSSTRPSVIDVNTLAGHYSMKQYFAGEVESLAKSDGSPRVLIVLSNYTNFAKEEAAAPLVLPADPNRRVFYLRMTVPQNSLETPGMEITNPARMVSLGGRGPREPRGWGSPSSSPDDLETILKSAGARVFHISGADDFRKAVAAVLDEIARM